MFFIKKERFIYHLPTFFIWSFKYTSLLKYRTLNYALASLLLFLCKLIYIETTIGISLAFFLFLSISFYIDSFSFSILICIIIILLYLFVFFYFGFVSFLFIIYQINIIFFNYKKLSCSQDSFLYIYYVSSL